MDDGSLRYWAQRPQQTARTFILSLHLSGGLCLGDGSLLLRDEKVVIPWCSALVDIHAQASQIRAGPLGRSLAIVHVGLMVFKPNKILEFNHFPHCSSAEWTVIVGGELPEKSSSAGKVIRQDAPGAWPPCPPSRSRQPPLRIAKSDSQQRTTCGVCPGGPNVFAN